MRTTTMALGAACLALALGACAQGSNGDDDGDPPTDAPRIDSADVPDGPLVDGPATDAPVIDAADIDAPPVDAPSIDAPVIDGAVVDGAVIDGAVVDAAPIDAGTPIDAMPTDAAPPIDAPCVPTTTQLLVNPSLDAEPPGTGWTQTLIDPMYPVVTGDDGIPEHTAPYKAWMGGIEAPNLMTVTDELWQQVTVPANTAQLRVRFQYEVRTAEAPGSVVYDSAQVDLVSTTNAVLQSVLTTSNVTPTTAWTPHALTFTQAYAGQQVRLRFRSTNDYLDPTSFYFDTIVLEAVSACP